VITILQQLLELEIFQVTVKIMRLFSYKIGKVNAKFTKKICVKKTTEDSTFKQMF